MRYILFVSILFGLLAGGVVLAQTEEAEETEQVTLEDLGIQDPGLLPISPFYFFKELGRGMQSFFAFNPVAKAELELKFSNEKAAEMRAVEERNPDDETGIARAIANYERSQERLASRLEGLRETSENPNIDQLLERVVGKMVLHEKLLQEISERNADKPQVASRILTIESKIANVARRAAEKDSPEKFAERLKNALEEGKGQLHELRAVEVLDRVSESIGGETKERLSEVREALRERAKDRIEELAGENEERLEQLLDSVPGDKARRTVILEEIRVRASDALTNILERAQNSLEESIFDAGDRLEKAAVQIRIATDVVEKAKVKVRELGEVREAVQTLVEQADRHLQAAQDAYDKAQYEEAFGQARAAEVVARNALRILETGETPPATLERVQDRVNIREKAQVPVEPARPSPDVVCTQEYEPVCGVDGKTYPNACVAQRQNGVRVQHVGECVVDLDAPSTDSGANIIDVEASRLTPSSVDSAQ